MAKNSDDSNPAGAGVPGEKPAKAEKPAGKPEKAQQADGHAGDPEKPAKGADKAAKGQHGAGQADHAGDSDPSGVPAAKAEEPAGKAQSAASAEPAGHAEKAAAKAGKPADPGGKPADPGGKPADPGGKPADPGGKPAEKTDRAGKSSGKSQGAAAGKGGGKRGAGAAPSGPHAPERREGYVPRLKHRYLEEVVPKLKREFGIENTMAVPRLERISLNMGMGEAIQNIKILDDAVDEMGALAGQRPTVTRSQKSIAAFKLRAGMPIGCRVTLRGERMWEFLDRFISVALPRVRDFRGVSPKSFDGRGNYTMGIRDHLIFLEIDYNKVERPKGMNITIVTTAGNDERALYLLRELGMPFARLLDKN